MGDRPHWAYHECCYVYICIVMLYWYAMLESKYENVCLLLDSEYENGYLRLDYECENYYLCA